jgi:hypothetical protein
MGQQIPNLHHITTIWRLFIKNRDVQVPFQRSFYPIALRWSLLIFMHHHPTDFKTKSGCNITVHQFAFPTWLVDRLKLSFLKEKTQTRRTDLLSYIRLAHPEHSTIKPDRGRQNQRNFKLTRYSTILRMVKMNSI